MSELVFENVYYRYFKAKSFALAGVDALFSAGEITSIVGPSGAGKSTLLYLISGLDVPTSGRILLDGKDLASYDLDIYRRNVVATISQSYLLFPTHTVLENVMYPLLLDKTDKAEAARIASDYLYSVGIDESLFKRMPSKLSGGEQQRVAIARCLAADSNIIVADEPTGNLDRDNTQAVIDLLLDLAHNKGKIVILGTHDKMLSDCADRHYIIVNGKLRKAEDQINNVND